ncbi:hypothetical protein OBBRIDRAFT_833923 [Obba rivulosa]|uniref:Uncharacterized protein n=1 Tax=Obba rivulosa TaxID=1052685 RepID=A0A8E2B4V3_9APHY|nr:hypothetical protein OBBRIDRAFT_833923 [Obba rivulosa]
MAPSFISSGHFNGPLYGSPAYHPQQGQDAQYLAFEQEARVASWPLPLVQPPHATQMPSISHTSHVHPPYATSSASRHQQVPLLDMSEVFHTQAMFHDLCGMELLYPDDDSLGTNEPAPPTALPGWNMQTHGFGFNNGYDAYSEVSFNGHASLMESARRQRVASGPEAGMSTPKTEQDLSGRTITGGRGKDMRIPSSIAPMWTRIAGSRSSARAAQLALRAKMSLYDISGPEATESAHRAPAVGESDNVF